MDIDIRKDISMAEKIASVAESEGGHVYYVGGFVRDRVLGLEVKDVDIEVHGITEERLREILQNLGSVMEIGAGFGIFGIKGCGLDIALPRTERKTGSGHRDFAVAADPFIGTYKAAQRRDFTVNAMMQDVLTGEVTDHFGGMEDLRRGVLRHVSDRTFGEDPLRVLRGAQFAARFGFEMAPETACICREIDLGNLPRERIEEELKKALLKAERPSVFFEVLREADQLDVWFPEVKALMGIPQSDRFHREGDVWNHTMLTLDNGAKLRNKVQEPYLFMLSALTHDFGKIEATEYVNGALHAYSHETLGLPLVHEFIRRITHEAKTMKYVMNMTELHMMPNRMKPGRNGGDGKADEGAKLKSTNRMFDRAVCPNDLIYLAIADGRSAISDEPFIDPEEFLLERLRIYEELMAAPHVTGSDLIAAGLVPDESFRDILDHAHKLRLAGISKEESLKQILGYARTLR